MMNAASTELKPLRILVLDDEPGILRMFQTALANYGYVTEAASDATAALELLAQRRFDVVVTDVHMPGCGGIDFLRRLRERCGPIPVIVMTGRASDETSTQARELGAFRCLTKPVMPRTLRDVIESATRPRQ